MTWCVLTEARAQACDGHSDVAADDAKSFSLFLSLVSPQMILVAVFSETGFFDYCAVKVGLLS